MKLVSSYDSAYETHERTTLIPEATRTALDAVSQEQSTLCAMAEALGPLIEDAETVDELHQAESECLALLGRIRALQVAKNYAMTLAREGGRET